MPQPTGVLGPRQRRPAPETDEGYLDVGGLIEAVHLVEQLQKDSLDFSIGAGLSVETFGGDGVDLVDEDDGRAVLLGQAEHVADLK